MTDHARNNQKIEGHLGLQLGEFALDAKFAFPAKGVTALFGPSGSGKSTLLRAISGMEKKATGWLTVNNQPWQTTERQLAAHRRPVGYVFQDGNLFDHLNVRDNLLFGYRRVAAEERKLHPNDIVERLRLEPLLNRNIRRLSGGERQRVAIGRALLTSPQLLLLDEPLSALDKQSRNEILHYLEDLRGVLSTPVLYVSHSHEEVARLADYLLLIQSGRIIAQGVTHQLINRLHSPATTAGESYCVLHCTLLEQLERFQLTRLSILGENSALLGEDLATGGEDLGKNPPVIETLSQTLSETKTLLVPAVTGQQGDSIRLRVRAKDVSLCLSKPSGTSILNILAVQVREISESDSGQRLLLLGSDSVTLMALISEMSFQHLDLKPGQSVYAQIKSAALLS